MTIYEFGGRAPTVPDSGDFWVAPGARLIGDVTVAAGASVWFGATLRGDNEPIVLGSDSNVQEHCVLHTDPGFPLTIGTECTIGHRAILHGCSVGNGALIGMGAIVLNGAKIGARSLLGAGALVAEGKEIPAGALVLGAPARVVRMLDRAEQRKLTDAAGHYRERMRQFRKGLRIIG
ncbi:MAG: gamma carbonic anhydrase family protein [Rhodobacter sp.]|nr:gamma carbonic anhydrase family protein [Rhodobacter sp.]MCY4169064.1 gamma carbonic anhydrase family protein [Rhodobacter sp.]